METINTNTDSAGSSSFETVTIRKEESKNTKIIENIDQFSNL